MENNKKKELRDSKSWMGISWAYNKSNDSNDIEAFNTMINETGINVRHWNKATQKEFPNMKQYIAHLCHSEDLINKLKERGFTIETRMLEEFDCIDWKVWECFTVEEVEELIKTLDYAVNSTLSNSVKEKLLNFSKPTVWEDV